MIVLLDPLPVVAVNSREPREERLYTMGGLWIRKEITEHRSRPAGHMRKSQRVVDWVDATVVPPDPAELGSPPPLSPARSLIGMKIVHNYTQVILTAFQEAHSILLHSN